MNAAVATLRPQAIGWWGKLPARGDFVGDGLPRDWLRRWDGWLQRALAEAARNLGPARLRERLAAMRPWQCVVLPRRPDEPAHLGVVAPSQDRVGRVFPMLLAEAYDAAALDAASAAQLQARGLTLADWLDRVGTLASPSAFAAGAAQLAATAWPARASADAPDAPTLAGWRTASPDAASFWWCPEPLDGPPEPLGERWPPSETLVLDWLVGG
jgi:type VI secretion system protein ImpM